MPHGNRSISSILCPCLAGAKAETNKWGDTASEQAVKENPTSPTVSKRHTQDNESDRSGGKVACVIRKLSAKNKDSPSVPKSTKRKAGGCTDQDEVTFEFERHSNASSMHQIPSLHTETDLYPDRETGSKGERRAKTVASRHSVDDAGSYRSVLKIDRTPSLSYCSEAGVAKSSSVLVNIPSSRGSLSSFERWSTRRSPSSDGGRRSSLALSNTADPNCASSHQHHHVDKIDIHSYSQAIAQSWSSRSVNSQERKVTT